MSMAELRTYGSFKAFVEEIKELKQQYVDRYGDCKNLRNFGLCQGAIEAIGTIIDMTERTEEEEEPE